MSENWDGTSGGAGDPIDPYPGEVTTVTTTDLATGTTTIVSDLDGDGFMESGSYDLDGDGVIDTTITMDPTTGGSVTEMDTDGDGVADSMFIDLDGDAYADLAYTTPGTELDPGAPVAPSDPPAEAEVPDGPAVDATATTSPGLDSADTSDPDLFVTAEEVPEAGEEGVHGDPRGDMEYHTVQPGPVDCLPTSVSMIISEVTGVDVPAEELVALAHEHGFMTDSGMVVEDALTLLASYGVDATVEHGDADTLRTALDAGDEVVLAIDSADLYADGGGPFDTGMTSGHAVVLTGIDDGPPAYVYINDPAFADGAGVQVPLEDFMDAWDDSECAMLSIPVAEEVGAAAATTSRETTEADVAPASSSSRRMLLLPLTLLVDAARLALGADRD